MLTNALRKRVHPIPQGIGAVAILLVCTMSLSSPTEAGDVTSEDQPEPGKTLTVSGTGKVSVAPDIAYITLGVVTEDADARVAQQRNAEQMSRIVEQIKNSGVPPEDIMTISFTITQRYRHDRESRESSLEGYTVNNSVQVTIRDISRTGEVMDLASRYGMNLSGGVSFALSDYETHYRKALKEAGTVARGRAYALAESLGVILEGPVTASEEGGYEPVPRPMRALGTTAESYSTPVESGTMTVEATVTVVYEF